MKATELSEFLQFAIRNKFPILVKGKPGIGKSDLVDLVAMLTGAELLIGHPSVSDPTDFKGMPFVGVHGNSVLPQADFLPFGDLRKLITATKLTIYFIDDLGQASSAVQAAVMQLILARQINGQKISDYVTFIAATNRKEDKAAVGGLLEPVKSRFHSIVELDVDTEDWVKWALGHNMPTELIAFIRFRPELLDKFVATKDIVNTPTPRTIANIGKMQNAGIPAGLEFEAFKGAAGEAFAAEYTGFLQIFRELPSIEQIILSPDTAPVPEKAASLYALAGALAHRANVNTIQSIVTYIKRLPGEIGVAAMKDAMTRDKDITSTRGFIQWATDNAGVIL